MSLLTNRVEYVNMKSVITNVKYYMKGIYAMKSTGIIRQVDNLGRFVIPKEIRAVLQIDSNDYLEIFTEGDRIVLKKYAPSCTFCGEPDSVTTFKGKLVCASCISALSSLSDLLPN